MSLEKGIILKVDPERRIGVDDVLKMLKGLRDDTFFEVIKTSEKSTEKNQHESIKSFYNSDNKNKSNHVTGNTDLPQIRELNEIAILLRNLGNEQNSFEN